MNNMWGMNGYPMMGNNMQREFELAQLRQMKSARDQVEATEKKLETLIQEVKSLEEKIKTQTVLKKNYDTDHEKRTTEAFSQKEKALVSQHGVMPSNLRMLHLGISIICIIASAIFIGFLCPDADQFVKIEIITCMISIGLILCTIFYLIANSIFSAINDGMYCMDDGGIIAFVTLDMLTIILLIGFFSSFWNAITTTPSILMSLIPMSGVILMTFVVAPLLALKGKKQCHNQLAQLDKEKQQAIKAAQEADKSAQQTFQMDKQKENDLREKTYPKLWQQKQDQFQELFKTYQQQMQYLSSVNVLGEQGTRQSSAYLERLIKCIDGRYADSIKEAVNKVEKDTREAFEFSTLQEQLKGIGNKLISEAERTTNEAKRTRVAEERKADAIQKILDENERHNREKEEILRRG